VKKQIVCPQCGHIIETKDGEFTTLRVSKEFVGRLKKEQIDPTHEDTLRRLLGWEKKDIK